MSELKSMVKHVLEQLCLIRVMSKNGNKSPHKYFFLLMLAKLYEENPSRENCFYLNDSLENKYVSIWTEKYPGIKQ